MIRMSLKGLAKFMLASDSGKRTILRNYKYPSPEAQIQALYYREARDFIKAFYKNNHPREWLRQEADKLQVLSNEATDITAVRLKHNARALQQYEEHFGDRRFEILKDQKLQLAIGPLVVSILPDLHVRERGNEELIKLEFSQTEPDARVVRILTQVMSEAVNQSLLGDIDVFLIDVPRAKVYRGSKTGIRMTRELSDASDNIAAIWDRV